MYNEFIMLLNKMYNDIFPDDDKNLSQFEKRNRIFDYMVDNIKYDYELLEKIKYNKKNGTKFHRNASEEIMSVLNNTHKGICNAISQVYKLLLEISGVYSICVNCDDTTEIYHQLNLVKTGDTYSFDDITSVIVGRGTKNEFFNYDLETAFKNKQGTKIIKDLNKYFIGIKSRKIYSDIGLGDFGLNYLNVRDPEFKEETYNGILPLPQNIGKYQENTFIL